MDLQALRSVYRLVDGTPISRRVRIVVAHGDSSFFWSAKVGNRRHSREYSGRRERIGRIEGRWGEMKVCAEADESNFARSASMRAGWSWRGTMRKLHQNRHPKTRAKGGHVSYVPPFGLIIMLREGLHIISCSLQHPIAATGTWQPSRESSASVGLPPIGVIQTGWRRDSRSLRWVEPSNSVRVRNRKANQRGAPSVR